MGKNWLKESFSGEVFKDNALFDQLNKLMGGELRFSDREFYRLSKALEAAQSDTEATAALTQLLKEKIAQMGESSSSEMRKLSQGVKIVNEHLKDMGVNTEQVYQKLINTKKYTPGNYANISEHFKTSYVKKQVFRQKKS